MNGVQSGQTKLMLRPSNLKQDRSHGLDALSSEVTFLLQLLHDALALLLAWNSSNDLCCLRYALGGVIHAQ